MSTLNRRLLLCTVLAATAGCATAEPAPDAAPPTAAQVVRGSLVLAGSSYDVDWFVPTGAVPRALVTVQHGFARRCANLRQTGLQVAAAGVLGLCIEASMAGGNPALADALAQALVAGIAGPDGQPVPERVIVGGHSAGGDFAVRLGWRLATQVPQRLAGAVLWDPVAARSDFASRLATISDSGLRPVYAVTSPPSACNANANTAAALHQVSQGAIGAGGDGFVGLRLDKDGTHVDAEGRDTTALATLACGVPRPPNTDALRTLSARWAGDIADGTRASDAYPGGAYVDGLLGSGRAQAIE